MGDVQQGKCAKYKFNSLDNFNCVCFLNLYVYGSVNMTIARVIRFVLQYS